MNILRIHVCPDGCVLIYLWMMFTGVSVRVKCCVCVRVFVCKRKRDRERERKRKSYLLRLLASYSGGVLFVTRTGLSPPPGLSSTMIVMAMECEWQAGSHVVAGSRKLEPPQSLTLVCPSSKLCTRLELLTPSSVKYLSFISFLPSLFLLISFNFSVIFF